MENLASRRFDFSFWMNFEFDDGNTVIERSMDKMVNWNIETFGRFQGQGYTVKRFTVVLTG